MQVNFDISKPIYEQVISEIKRALVRGELSVGDKLPSQRDLAQELQVNHNTIQRAYREMEGVGLVKTVRGMGTYLTDDQSIVFKIRQEMAEETIGRFILEMIALGMSGHEIVRLVEDGVHKYEDGVI